VGYTEALEEAAHRPPQLHVAAAGDPDAAIAFHDVDIATPSGAVLAQGLSFRVRRGQRLFVSGPNGSGKTAISRVARGLWAPSNSAARVDVPALQDCVFLPQRAYIVPGLTLRAQLAYPTPVDDDGDDDVAAAAASASAVSAADDKMLAVLRRVGLGSLAAAPADLSSRVACEGLSAGERQRLAIARLLLRAPAFAVLDEATSAVPEAFEAWFFEACVDAGTTLVTVSHRAALARYHTHGLTFDGSGQWRSYEMTASTASIGSGGRE